MPPKPATPAPAAESTTPAPAPAKPAKEKAPKEKAPKAPAAGPTPESDESNPLPSMIDLRVGKIVAGEIILDYFN